VKPELPPSFWKGLLFALPPSILLWALILWLGSALV
jgi:hypothetical protein